MNHLIDEYDRLNSSFKKTLVFHLGVDAGFFSEYNNMILAMLYCLENKIRFVLYSRDANFGYDKGWTDYFMPFCEEESGQFHAKYNYRHPKNIFYLALRPQIMFYHLSHKNTLLTYEIFNLAHNRNREQKHFYIPELGIDGGLQDACRVLLEMTWRYNPETQERITRLTSSLQLPATYAGVHIRGGDKVIEAPQQAVSEYLNKLLEVSGEKNIFILTDDYRFIDEWRLQSKEFVIHTLVGKDECGYFHREFEKQNRNFIKRSQDKLCASIDILSTAQTFIGTLSSNIGMYLGMRMPEEKVFGIDLDKWQIW
jgi:hypothetical protein